MSVDTHSFCEWVTAGPNSPWHIRPLTNLGRRMSGGADANSLCGRVVAWDIKAPIRGVCLRVACRACQAEWAERGART